MRFKTNYALFIGVVLFWLIALITKIKFNGLVYGLDFGLFHPDGKLYSFRTLTLIGKTEFESGLIVSDWYRENAFKLNDFNASSLYFDTNPLWQLYKPRILYPLLSVPFVALFGMQGMLFVPALSMLILMFSIQLIGLKLEKREIGFLISILISISPVVSRWMFANITDSLLTAISSLFVVCLLYIKNSKIFLLVAGILLILGSLTRISVLEWLAISICMYLVNQKKASFLLAGLTLVSFAPSALGNLETGILPNEKGSSVAERPILLLISMARIAFYEVSQLAVLDRLLLLLLGLAIVVSVRNIGRASSKYFLLVLFALWLTGAVNGTLGVNFRYQLPILPFLAYTVIDNWNTKLWRKGNPPERSNKE